MASRVEALEALVKRVVEADKTTDDTGTTDTAMFVDVVREDVNLDVPSARTPGPDDEHDTGRSMSMTIPDSLARGQQADDHHGDGFQDTLDEFMVRPSADQIDPSSLTRMSANLDVDQPSYNYNGPLFSSGPSLHGNIEASNFPFSPFDPITGVDSMVAQLGDEEETRPILECYYRHFAWQ